MCSNHIAANVIITFNNLNIVCLNSYVTLRRCTAFQTREPDWCSDFVVIRVIIIVILRALALLMILIMNTCMFFRVQWSVWKQKKGTCRCSSTRGARTWVYEDRVDRLIAVLQTLLMLQVTELMERTPGCSPHSHLGRTVFDDWVGSTCRVRPVRFLLPYKD